MSKKEKGRENISGKRDDKEGTKGRKKERGLEKKVEKKNKGERKKKVRLLLY